MRWRFPEPADRAETEERAAKLLAIEEFWRAFSDAAAEIAFSFTAPASFDVVVFMARHLQCIDAHLCPGVLAWVMRRPRGG